MADFQQSDLEQMIRRSVEEFMTDYDEEYFFEKRMEQEHPTEYWRELAEHGWVGVTIPEDYGGQGLGIQQLVYVIEEVIANGAHLQPGDFVRTVVFGGETLKAHGTADQKEEWLPRIAAGEAQWALGLTEPDAGLNTANISTTAQRNGDEFVLDGRKIWTSGGAEADRITLLARTTPKKEADKPSNGLTLFLVDPDAPGVEFEEIPIDLLDHGKTYNTYLDGVRVPAEAIVGEIDKGLYHVFNTLNSERITLAAQTVAVGYVALEMASEYAAEREVFDAPIGTHQAIQHPLADAYAELQAAELLTHKAAWLYDSNREQPAIGSVANAANLQAGKAAWNACEAAMTTFGGMSASIELGLSKLWGDVRHLRSAPISEEMIRNYLAENQLNLPKSY